MSFLLTLFYKFIRYIKVQEQIKIKLNKKQAVSSLIVYLKKIIAPSGLKVKLWDT